MESTERVLTRLGTGASKDMRDGLLEAQDTVMWCVRAEHWDGQLTAAVTQLQQLVQEAEAQASRVAG